MQIDESLVLKLENLAKLDLSNEERMVIQKDLSSILDMVGKIQEVDTTGITPLIHLNEEGIGLRKDEVSEKMPTSEALQNAPKRSGNYFAVPKVISA